MLKLTRGGTLALACAVYAAAGLSLSSLGPSLPSLAAHVGQSVASVGAQFAAFSVGTVLVQLVAPALGKRFGQRAMLGVGALLLGFGMIGESLSGSMALLLAFALLGGLGFGCVLSAGVLLVARLYPDREASALNLVNLFFGVGSILGPLAAGFARARWTAPEAAVILGALLLIALAPLLALATEAASAVGRAEAAGPVPWGIVLLLGLLLLVYSGTEIAVGGWATLYLEASAGMAPAAVALALSGFWLALTAGRALGALLGLRVGSLPLLGGSLALILLAAGLLLASVGQATFSVLALALLGLGCGPIFPTTMALVAAISGGRSAAASLALAVGNLGAGTIPPLLGVVLEESGPRAGVLLLLAAALLMPMLLAAIALRTAQRPRPVAG